MSYSRRLRAKLGNPLSFSLFPARGWEAPEGRQDHVFSTSSKLRKKSIVTALAMVCFICLASALSFTLPGLLNGGAISGSIARSSAMAEPIGAEAQATTGSTTRYRLTGKLGAAPAAKGVAPQDIGACGTARPANRNRIGLPKAPTVYGFLPYDEDWNYLSLAGACGGLNVLMPEWFRLSPKGLESLGTSTDPEDPKQQVLAEVARIHDNVRIVPVITVANAPASDDARILAKGLPGPKAIAALATLAESEHYDGYGIDLSGLSAQNANLLAPFLTQLHAALKAKGVGLDLIAQAATLADLDPALTAAADKVVVKLYQARDGGATPAPLASAAEMKAQIARAKARIGAGRLVLAFGAGGSDWKAGSDAPAPVSFQRAMTLAHRFNGTIGFDRASMNPYVAYTDDKGAPHKIWMLDAVTTYNGMVEAARQGISDVAVWNIGQEDPSIWRLLNARLPQGQDWLSQLTGINLGHLAVYYGKGVFLHIRSEPREGRRQISHDEQSGLLYERYAKTPLPYLVRRWGQTKPKTIALTFDDGPSAAYTPGVLKALRENHVHATFFEIGKHQLLYPGIVREVLRDGNEIGSHTFFHPHMGLISDYRVRTELDVQQRLMASETGRHLVLFRAPYFRGLGPLEPARLHKLALIDSLGFIITSSQIVSPDWEVKNAQDLANYVISQVEAGDGSIIQMHDAGGNRSATVAALPIIIQTLKARGYSFGTVSDAIGATRAEMMPQSDGWFADIIAFFLVRNIADYLTIFLAAGIGFGVVRILAIGVISTLRKPHQPTDPDFLPGVTVLIPAFNEAKVITRTVQAALDSDYPDFEVLVIDDGSSDETATLVEDTFADDPRVRVLRQRNGGKWKALNAGIRAASNGYVVCIDADTSIDKGAIRRMMPHFSDLSVGGVAGNVKVGNRVNAITRLQALEYAISQSVDRRAFEYLNAITVVPGALGAWRIRALDVAGHYCDHTLAEDADLTLTVARAGYRIVFEEHAISYTEAPDRVSQVMRQRLRWSFGMMQAGWKHRGAFRQGHPLGLIALPDLAIFGVFVNLIAPLVDAMLLVNILTLAYTALNGGSILPDHADEMIILSYLLLPLLDLTAAIFAFWLDGTEDRRLLWYFPLQKIYYRQILYISVLRAAWRAVTGRLALWTKMDRTATALSPQTYQTVRIKNTEA